MVLVNRATAGSAEIVAAALQDSGRAKVIGEPTFRYGRLQTIMPLPPYGALRLSTAIIERPSGRKLGDGGVTPDLEVAWTPPSADSGLLNSFGDPAFDAPYAAALRFLDEEIKLSATPPRTP